MYFARKHCVLPKRSDTHRKLKGWKHIFDPYTVLSWKTPYAFRKAGLSYYKLGKSRHRDVFSREWYGVSAIHGPMWDWDYYLHL